MIVSLIVAAGENGVIGKDNQLLWRLRSDMKRFRALTLGKPVIMGWKTFNSIGKPLEGRDNIIVTRDPDFEIEGAFVERSVEDALALGRVKAGDRGDLEIMVIGGAEIYEQALPMADRIYFSRVHVSLEGDAFFPPIDDEVWFQRSLEPYLADESNDYGYDFVIYERSTPK